MTQEIQMLELLDQYASLAAMAFYAGMLIWLFNGARREVARGRR